MGLCVELLNEILRLSSFSILERFRGRMVLQHKFSEAAPARALTSRNFAGAFRDQFGLFAATGPRFSDEANFIHSP